LVHGAADTINCGMNRIDPTKPDAQVDRVWYDAGLDNLKYCGQDSHNPPPGS
jgi:hypothetical protein